jgi:hypothetical protein
MLQSSVMIQPLLVYFMRTYSAYPWGVLRASLDAVTWVVPRLVYPHRRGRRQALYLQPGSDALLIPDLVRCAWSALWQPQSGAAALPPATRQPQRHGPAPHGLTGFQVRGASSSRSAINRRAASTTWLQNFSYGKAHRRLLRMKTPSCGATAPRHFDSAVDSVVSNNRFGSSIQMAEMPFDSA